MVLHVERTLETTIQRNLTKYQKSARKVYVADFYSQTILLWFTVILFHSNLDEKVTSNEQKVANKQQKVTSNEQKVQPSSRNRTHVKVLQTFDKAVQQTLCHVWAR